MSPSWRRFGRRARFAIGALLATVLIATAAAMALGQLLLPLLHNHPQEVARLLSWRLQQPVSVGAVDGEWQSSGPLLSAQNLHIGRGAHALRLPHAQLKVDFGAWLKPDRRWLELRVTGLQADIRRDLAGHWHLTGLSSAAQQTDAAALTDLPVGLLLRDVTLNIDDAKSQDHWRLQASLLRAVNQGDSLRVAAQITRTPSSLSDFGGRGENSAVRGQIFDDSPAHSGSMGRRIGGNMDRTDGFAARPSKARQAASASPLTVVLHVDSQQHVARMYVAGEDIDLAQWTDGLAWSGVQLEAGQATRLRLWLDWRDGRLSKVSSILAVKDLRVSSASQKDLQVAQWNARLQAQRDGDGWRATYAETQAAVDKPQVSARLHWQPQADGGASVEVDATQLDIAAMAPWLGLWSHLPARLAAWLQVAKPHGVIEQVHAHWVDAKQFDVQAQLHDLGFTAVGMLPGVDALSAELRADAEALSLSLPAQAVSIDEPKVFRQPFALSRIQGNVAAWRRDGGWQVGSDALQVDGAGFAVKARGAVSLMPGKSPLLDLAANVTQASLPAATQFWPVNVMPQAAVEWLDRAFVAGTVSSAHAVFRGHLADWPFRDGAGHFDAVAHVKNATLDYDVGWPRAQGLAARARFVNDGMQITATTARSLGNVLDHATANIADFAEPALDLRLQGHGGRDHAMRFVQQSPLGKRFASALQGLKVTGKASVDMHLSMPLHDAEETAGVLKGKVQLHNATFSAPAWSLQLNQLNGTLNFDKDGFASKDLHGQYHAQPVVLGLNVGAAVIDPKHQLEASMHGRFDAASLLQGFATLQPLLDISQGSADFDVGVSIDSGTDLAAAKPHLSLASDLRGMTLTLPAPLNKPANASLPLRLGVDLPFAGSTLDVHLGEVLNAQLHLADAASALAANIALGGPAQAPPSQGIVVHGHVMQLDLSGWISWAMGLAGGGGGDKFLREVDIAAQQLSIFGQRFKNLALRLQPGPQKTLLTVAGEQVDGNISLPTSDLAQRGITAKFQRLYWPDDAADQAPAADAEASMAPAAVPPLHLWIGDLRLGHARLGETRFESYPTADGMHVERLETHSPDVQISARGNWMGTAESNHTHLAIDFSSDDLGRMLDAFGYPGLVAGGTTLAHVDGIWPGPPSAFSLTDLDGSMKVHVEEGRILKVEPGVGRLFGLFSFRELPRRLSLDFGDLFQSGFSFNTLDGHFAFSDGNAQTQDLKIQGPSASIAIRGRTGLRQHDYDQFIDVSPHVGVALPVVGAIAAGPLGAAAGLAMQSLLGRGLGKAAGAHYHVTGSWDHPTITLLARDHKAHAGQPAAAASAPASPSSAPAPTSMPAPAATSVSALPATTTLGQLPSSVVYMRNTP